MEEIINFKSISEYNNFNNNETLHPLVSVVDLSKADPRKLSKLRYEFYTVFFKEIKCGDLRYGLKNYDYEEGTLIFLAPGQVIGENGTEFYQPQGRGQHWYFIQSCFMVLRWQRRLPTIRSFPIQLARRFIFPSRRGGSLWIASTK